MDSDRIAFLKDKVHQAKRSVLEMCVNAGMGHVTSAYSCAEILVALYYDIMKINPQKPDDENRDRFIMSKNHGSVMTFPILADLGFIDSSLLMTFMKDGSPLGGHSKMSLNGVDFSGGSLGIGFGVAAGVAYGAKLDNKDFFTYVLIGDGECYEGSIWESAMFASHNKLNNLIAIVDRNELACTDFTEKMLAQEPMQDKWKSFGWETIEVDGHNLEKVLSALKNSKTRNNTEPLCIIAHTVKGKGVDFMSQKPLCHGAAPSGDDIKRAFSVLEKGANI